MGNTSVLVEADWTSPVKKQELEIIYDDYIFRFDDTLDWSSKLSSCKNDFTVENLSKKNNLIFQPISIDPKSPLDNELIHFDECIKNKKEPITSGAEGVAVLEMLELFNDK